MLKNCNNEYELEKTEDDMDYLVRIFMIGNT